MKRGRATTDLFAEMNVVTGQVLYDTKDSHAAKDVLGFFKYLDRTVTRSLEIHVVLDNLSMRKAVLVRKWL